MITPLVFLLAWTPLFDGKTLDGWTQCNGKASYRVEDGTIVGRTVEGSPNSFLCTNRAYGDFVLEFETKTDPVLNSGVQIRSHRYEAETRVTIQNKGRREAKQPAGRVYGYQVEVSNEKAGNSGGVYDEARRGWLQDTSTDPACRAAFKDNQWNKYRIEARGPHLRTFVNGVGCTDLLDAADMSGFIGLQVHAYKGEKPAEVRWRDLRIEDLGTQSWKPVTAWKPMGGGSWKQEDGAWHGTHGPTMGERGFLVSERSFADFTLRLQYKIAKGNSGVFFRMGDLAAAEKNRMGYEVEVDPARDPGGLQEPGSRNWLVHTGPMAEAWFYKNEEWNEMVIIAQGGRIATFVNGVKTVEVKDDPGRREGRVALQLNPRQELEVWYRNIEVIAK